MTDLKDILYLAGQENARTLREHAPDMTGTAIIAQEDNVPAWASDKDYTLCQPGIPALWGGQVWLLLTPHNAAHYSGTPESLRSLWGIAHTTDPAGAKPWIAPYGTSGLYREGECCTWAGKVWRNLFDNNAYPPQTLNAESRWEEVTL